MTCLIHALNHFETNDSQRFHEAVLRKHPFSLTASHLNQGSQVIAEVWSEIRGGATHTGGVTEMGGGTQRGGVTQILAAPKFNFTYCS